MLLKRVLLLMSILSFTLISFNFGNIPGDTYQVINDCYIKAVKYSNYPHYVQIFHNVKENDCIFADIKSYKNRFMHVPRYLINTGYIQSFYYDKNNNDDAYIRIKGNMDVIVYLAIQPGANMNEEVWSIKEKGVRINDYYFPNGVDIYTTSAIKYQALSIPGNRNLTAFGNTYLLFFEMDNSAVFGINFTESHDTDTPGGYFPDYGEEFSLKENGKTYGWNSDRTITRNTGEQRCVVPDNLLHGKDDCVKELEIKQLLNQSYTDITDDNIWNIMLPDGYYEVILGTSVPFNNTDYAHSLYMNEKEYLLEGDIHNPVYFEIKDFLTISRFNNNSISIKKAGSHIRLHYIRIKKIESVVMEILDAKDDEVITTPGQTRTYSENERCLQDPHHNTSLFLFDFTLYKVNDIACSYLELFFMNYGKDNHAKAALYAIPRSSLYRQDSYWSVYSSIVKKENFVDEILLTGRYGFCQFDISEFLLTNDEENIIFAVIPDTGTLDFLSRECKINQPKIIINFNKYTITTSGYISTDGMSFFLQTPALKEYLLESDFYDLNEYTEINAQISGYVDPIHTLETGDNKKIHITHLTVIPPELPSLSGDYYNNTGYPVWEWDRPLGASLFRYKLDEGDWVETHEESFTPGTKLDEGVHILSLQCKNRLSEWSQTVHTQTTVDYTPPALLSLTSSPPQDLTRPSFSWSFQDNFTHQEDLVYEYRIGDGDWISTSDTSVDIQYSLAEGDYTFFIKAKDLAGNWSGAFEYHFFIDLTPPEISEIIFASPTNTLKPVIRWIATDNYSESGELSFMVTFDESSEWVTTKKTTYTPDDYLTEGPHIFKIQAIDKAQNVSETKEAEILIDVTPPVIKRIIYSIPETVGGDSYYTWEVEDNLSDLPDLFYTYRFGGNNAPWNTTKNNICSVPSKFQEKAHTFTFIARDLAGNESKKIINTKRGITICSGEITLIIPEFALTEKYHITITKTDLLSQPDILLPGDSKIIEPFYILNPEGLLFNKDFHIKINYDSFDIPGDEERLQIFYYNTHSRTWQMLERVDLDKVNKVITSCSNHFSLFALGIPQLNTLEWVAPEIGEGQPVNEWFINGENSVMARVKEVVAENPDCDILTVYIREGDYYCRTNNESLYIQNIDFDGCEVIFRAYPGESVRFIGGVEIKQDDFTPVEDTDVLYKIPEASREQVVMVDLKEYGVEDFPSIKRRGRSYDSISDVYDYYDLPQELFFNTKPMEIARWPNKEIVDYESHKLCSVDDYALIHKESDVSFTIESPDDSTDRPLNWINSAEEDLWIFYFVNNNMEELIKADHVEQDTITLRYPPDYDDLLSGQRFYAFNILEELDHPGEYYIDRRAYNPENTGHLYFYPPDESGTDIYLSNVTTLLTIDQCSNLSFEAIVFEGAKENVIEVYNSNSIKFDRSVIRNCGKTGILISSEYNGKKGKRLYDGDRDEGIDAGINQLYTRNCKIVNSELYNTGEHALFAEGGNRAYLKPCNHLVENCRIFNFCRIVFSNSGLNIKGDGIQLLHNDIVNGPSIGIWYYGNDHLMKYNKLDRLCQEVDDMGAVYSGRKYSYRGNLILNNLISHTKTRFSNNAGVNALYFDHGASSAHIAGNILYDSNGSAVFIGGGRDYDVKQNVIAEHGAAVFMNRCAFFKYDEDDLDLEGDLNKYHYYEPPWSTKYPDLLSNFYDDDEWNRKMPEGNRLSNNIIYNSNQFEYIIDEIDIPPLGNNEFDYIKVGWFDGEFINPFQYDFLHFRYDIFFTDLLLKKSNNILSDPGFVDPENGDLSFSQGSVVRDLVANNKWSPGLWGDIVSNKTFFGCIPQKPDLTITGVSEENKIIVIGSAIPWCDIGEIYLYGYNDQDEIIASLDLRPFINVYDNGEFYGEVILSSEFLACEYCVVQMTVHQTREARFTLDDIIIESNILSFGYVDYDLPVITDFTVSDRTVTPAGIDVEVHIDGTDNLRISGWLITLDGNKPLLSDNRWQSERIETVRLPLKSGDHSLFAWCKDNSGNISRPASLVVTIPPLPVKGVLEFSQAGTYNWRFYDQYPFVKDVQVDVTIIGGGGKGGGGASQVADIDTYTVFCPVVIPFVGVVMVPCGEEEVVNNPDQKASGGGGGGAGEIVIKNVSQLDDTFNPNINYTIVVGRGGTNGGSGGCDQHSGGSGGSGQSSRFGDYSARAGQGGEGGDNNEPDEGAGGSGYPPGTPHDDYHGGDGGNNGSGYGRGGDGGNGDRYCDCGDSGNNGSSGYVKIEWYGHL